MRIVRDAFGVPAVHGDSAAAAWFGAGYAIAQDRLFQLEIFRRATTGRLAEVLGRSFVNRDMATRRDFYTETELLEQFGRLPGTLQERYHSYVAGVNAWIAETRRDPSKLNGEFAAIGIAPADLGLTEALAIGVYLARTTPDDGSGEYRNARALQELGPVLFDKLLPLRPRGTRTTIPRSEGIFRRDPGRSRRHERAAFKRSVAYVLDLPVPSQEPVYPVSATRFPEQPAPKEQAGAAALRRLSVGLGHGGSNLWAVRGADGTASLFNGPQVDWDIPSQLVELEVHAPGLDVRGFTAVGAPVIAAGHNGRVAWGITTGASDQDDLYAEQMVGDEGYRFRGEVEAMECRDERIPYSSPPSDLIPGSEPPPAPERGAETARLCRTRHGPVEMRSNGIAYARRYALWGREVETLLGLAAVNEAQSIQDVDRAADLLTWNENLMAVDDQGNIGYWHPGLLPLRSRRYDERLPLPGTGEAEWRGMLPPDRRPQVINPRQRYLTNWNNSPASGWTFADAGTRTILNGAFNRNAILDRAVRSATRRGGGFDATVAVDEFVSSVAQGRPPAARRLRLAHRGSRGNARRVLGVLRSWDGDYTRTDGEGRVEPGVATWDAFRKEAVGLALGRFGDAVALVDGGRTAQHAFDTRNSEAYALRVLSARGYRLAAERAFERLERRFKSADPAKWREARLVYTPGSTGAGTFAPFPFRDRGTLEFAAEMGP